NRRIRYRQVLWSRRNASCFNWCGCCGTVSLLASDRILGCCCNRGVQKIAQSIYDALCTLRDLFLLRSQNWGLSRNSSAQPRSNPQSKSVKDLASRQDDPIAGNESLQRWATEMRDDCKNVSLLLTSVRLRGPRCSVEDGACQFLYVCFWHAGDERRCFKDRKYADYVKAAASIYSRLGIAK